MRYGLLQAPARCTPAGACLFFGVGIHALNSEITFPRRAARRIFRGVNQGRKAFTLIELLAVVAITLILLGLLLPVINVVNAKGQQIKCISNLRQLTAAHTLYISDNNGQFIDYNTHLLFFDYLEAYHDPNPTVRLCASAPANPNPGTGTSAGTARTAYRWSGSNVCSYGINGFCYGLQDSTTGGSGKGGSGNPLNESPVRANVRYPEMWFGSYGGVAKPGQVPLFQDAMWPDGWPMHESYAALTSFNIETPYAGTGWYIERFMVNRHRRRTSVSFVDGGVRLVPLNEMWTLKWHRTFQQQPKHAAPELAPTA